MHYRLVFNGSLYQPAVNALRHRIAQVLELPDCNDLTLIFSSEGGSTDEGLSLYNFIRCLPKPVNIHAVGHVGSMAIPVFCAGHRRTCSPTSRFFFHTYDWGFEGRQSLERIQEAVIRLSSDIKLSSDIVERHTNISAERLESYYGTASGPTILTPEEAVAYGLCEEIVDLPMQGAGGEATAVWTIGW